MMASRMLLLCCCHRNQIIHIEMAVFQLFWFLRWLKFYIQSEWRIQWMPVITRQQWYGDTTEYNSIYNQEISIVSPFLVRRAAIPFFEWWLYSHFVSSSLSSIVLSLRVSIYLLRVSLYLLVINSMKFPFFSVSRLHVTQFHQVSPSGPDVTLGVLCPRRPGVPGSIPYVNIFPRRTGPVACGRWVKGNYMELCTVLSVVFQKSSSQIDRI